MILSYFKHPVVAIETLWKDLRMWMQKRTRLVPRTAVNGQFIVRGRIYKKKSELPFMPMKTKTQATLEMTVTRADGSVEKYIVDKNGQRRIK